MNNQVLAPDGRVVDPRFIDAVRQTAQADVGRMPFLRPESIYAYRAAEIGGQETSSWLPWNRSPDSEINQYRDRMVARQRDLVRNDGWASGGVDRILDNTIGGHFRLISKPDHLALSRVDKRLDADWASEFGGAVEAEWRMYADDIGCYADGMRQLDMTAQFRLALRHDLIDGEALAVLWFLPDFVGPYGARYATVVQQVDPDRLSNPDEQPDTATMRGGVEITANGAPVAYHLRRAEPNDWYDAADSMIWDRVERETPWKRPIVVHSFEKERATQHRGVGVLAPVVSRFRMLGRYDETELQQAILQASIRSFITAPMDHESLQDMVGGPQTYDYQEERAAYHRQLRTGIGGVRLNALYPGESIQTVPDNSNKQFQDFEAAVLRSIAARMGLSEGQLSQNYSRTNYSSARAALLEAWRTMSRRRSTFTRRFCNPIFGAWLEEALDGRLKGLLPRNAPSFPEWRTAYARCKWLGPARGWIDPVKERQGAVLGLDAGFSTLEQECAEQGLDWRETVQQRAVETKLMKSLDLKLPDWAGAPAQEVETKPEPV